MEHTEKSRLFEKVYIDLVHCCSEIKYNELTGFEEDRADKLLNFCNVMKEQFKDDKRFIHLFKERGCCE